MTRPKPGSDQEIQWLGANARAHGRSIVANPYREPPVFEADKQLGQDRWNRLAELWEIGWRLEGLTRGS